MVDDLNLPLSAQLLQERLVNLRKTRHQRQEEQRLMPIARRGLTAADRSIVLKKTNGRCHICGGHVSNRRKNQDDGAASQKSMPECFAWTHDADSRWIVLWPQAMAPKRGTALPAAARAAIERHDLNLRKDPIVIGWPQRGAVGQAPGPVQHESAGSHGAC